MLNGLHGHMRVLMSRLTRAASSGPAKAKFPWIGARVRSRHPLRDEGNALVEFALVLPILCMFITGIMSFGQTLMQYETLEHATAGAAQYVATLRGQTTNPCADAYAEFLRESPNLNPANITLFQVQLGTNTPGTTTCSGNQSQMVLGQTVTLQVKYSCKIGVYGLNLTSGCSLPAQVAEYEN
jgi:Flp pilus assembly protein TadG